MAALALPCLLVSMDAHVLNLAIPQLTSDLRPTNAELLWIVDSYGFLIAGLLLTMGAVGDRIGRRRLLLIGAAGFGAASVLAAFATSPSMLIAARALLGIAGATLMPSTLALIRVAFPDPRRRRTAFGVWTASFALGGLIAPVLAGVLLDRFWWGSVFLVAVPVMVALLVLGPALLPEFRDPAAARIDAASVLLSLACVFGVVFGVKRAAQDGLDVPAAAAIAAGLALGRAFVSASVATRRGSISPCFAGAPSPCRSRPTPWGSSSCTARRSSSCSTSSSCSGSRRWKPACGRSRRRSATSPGRRSPRWRRSASGPRGS
jgi:DHA2 family multidrug resistance protein-like MFS transporter